MFITRKSCVVALSAMLAWHGLAAHPDLELQIKDLSREIAGLPGNAELYLKRGDLYRRHADWRRAGFDFDRVRDLEPGHSQIDWFEGRLRVQAGAAEQGLRLLTRFLEQQPRSPAAWRERAYAHWQLGESTAAAGDFARAINYSVRPAPSLYRSQAIAEIAGGESRGVAAASVLNQGLDRFPQEVSLLGLAVDLALTRGDTVAAEAYLARLPRSVQALPQWGFRGALLACLEGGPGTAEKFRDLLPGEGAQRLGTWRVPVVRITRLADAPDSKACREAARASLGGLQP